MELTDLVRKVRATEYDMGWFCYKCERLVHWNEKSYVVNGHNYCYDCATKFLREGAKVN